MAFRVGEAEVVIGGNVVPLKRDLAVAEGMVKTAGTKMAAGMSSAMKATMAGMGLALGAAGAAMLTKSILSIGADFERSMATVKGVMRATDSQFVALTATAKRLGETTEWTAGQAAGGLKFLGMAGFTAEKAIAALPGVLDLATAGGVELARSADIASNALSAMRLDVSELGRVNDVFVSTITRSNTNMEMLAEAFKYGAPKAQAYGYSIEELSGMIGALGNAGVQGSMAGTQLSFAFSRVAKVAKKLGLGEGAKLVDVLAAMNAQGYSAAQTMDAFGERGGRAALVLKGMIPNVLELTAANKAAGGEAKRLADTMRNTVTGAFTELKSAIEGIAIDAFSSQQSQLAGSIRGLTASVRDNKDAWVALAASLTTVAGWMVTLAAAAGRAMHSMFSSGTEEYQRFMKIVNAGFARMEDWGAVSSNGKEAMDAWLKAAEKRMSDFKLNPNWSRMLVPPTTAELRDSWATQSGVVPEFPVKMNVSINDEELKKEAEKAAKLLESELKAAQVEFEVTLVYNDENSQAAMLEQAQRMAPKTGALFEGKDLLNRPDTSYDPAAWALITAAEEEAIKLANEFNLALEQSPVGSQAQVMEEALLRAKGAQAEATLEREKTIQSESDMYKKHAEQITTVNELMATSMTDNLLDMADGTKKMGQAFKDMATGILRDLAAMIIKQAIFNALQAASRSIFGFSEGGVFSPGSGHSNEAFAAGGVIRKPTRFAYGGGIGLMGEKGAEAIMPLTNTSKGLGVMAQMPVNDNGKNGGVTLVLENLNINAVDSQSFFELTARNPEAILQPIKEALIIGDIGLRSLLKE